jgi:hypothetical protein
VGERQFPRRAPPAPGRRRVRAGAAGGRCSNWRRRG